MGSETVHSFCEAENARIRLLRNQAKKDWFWMVCTASNYEQWKQKFLSKECILCGQHAFIIQWSPNIFIYSP